ncbi:MULTISPECIES: TetR/AcrR family transcriptional regulator [unclassified Mycolicibacterium]|uniref:TetR/AcrR family transcriptional regulator n=1 Tax=unclassified Mycolicibacterium TaxID=2636767 RepID=UPI0012DC9801|nr:MULTISPECIES: TetR/AcrR family transcriptional regulator [unclassified Mycolicibacterium]MUL84726.1 TetR/AcrR family transcriptional regulator [Mycolicibacterium sp. CBMA 329]MUL88501.1 TetR/AcrR family transcriptional regulator [Mycolicibacterium sp. CBMA 331]MUM00160.1 TetR/AcrR family transcriptional regulator [Mycolicibacterium sp. CBMA 334]MUM27824.1 TetR/AcrR family transcriptional regulator [Mycolicibacterium sp. CBMA 295]MUM40148.1 TetR/AcrR family transcriptional regulator [Mycolic
MARAPIGRQQLLDAARNELVHGNGVIELSGLTRRAGLSTGALYHHFGSKSGLLAAIYDGFYDGLRHAIADAHLPTGDWATRERDRTHRFVAYHLSEPLAPILLNRTASDPQLTELEAAYIHDLIDNAAANIRHGQHLGQLPADLDPDSAGAYVIGGLRHGIAQQLRVTPAPDTDQAAQTLWRFTAAALGIA